MRKKDAWDLPLEEHQEGRDAVAYAAACGGLSTAEVAAFMGRDRQDVERIEFIALRKLRAALAMMIH